MLLAEKQSVSGVEHAGDRPAITRLVLAMNAPPSPSVDGVVALDLPGPTRRPGSAAAGGRHIFAVGLSRVLGLLVGTIGLVPSPAPAAGGGRRRRVRPPTARGAL
jgi:hypothetical protein